jgi:hypothetical protein
MIKITFRRVYSVGLVVALIVAVGGLAVAAQESDEALKKKYAPLLGEYEFDVDGQIMLVSFWVESGGLWGGPEGQEAAELTPVEGNDLKFEINTPDGQYMELEFKKDESGAVVKCTVLMMGMEMEGVKIKK